MPARDPQELEPLLILLQRQGDSDGMVALYERDAVLENDKGDRLSGVEEIKRFFEKDIAAGIQYKSGEQRAPIVVGDLALTSTLLPDGSVTTEVARRQEDGSWRWVIDRFSVS